MKAEKPRRAILPALVISIVLLTHGFVGAQPQTNEYVFIPSQSTVVQTGGFAGVNETHTIEGQFQLTVDFDANIASFDQVDATLSESVYLPTQDLGELFQMTELVSTDVNETAIDFVDTNPPLGGIDINIRLTFMDDLVHLNGKRTDPWPDGFQYDLDAVARRVVVYYVNAVDGNDNNDGLTPETAFATIQKGIDEAQNGYTVIVLPGVYTGTGNKDLDFGGKAITVQSSEPSDPNIVTATIIDCENSGRGFNFYSGEGPNSVVCGFTITNGYLEHGHGGGIYCNGASPTITKNVITSNTALSLTITPSSLGGGICCINSSAIIRNNLIAGNYVRGQGGGIFSDSASIINNTVANNYSFSANFESSVGGIYCIGSSSVVNTIIWDNFGYFSPKQMYGCTNVTYSDIQDGYEGEGNIDADPCFVRLGYWEYVEPNLIFHEGDYHLLSERGRYWPQYNVWVLDDVTSPCIDGGDPNVNPSNEPMPNGARINMGAYGNTAYASMSEWPTKGDINRDGVVNMMDLAIVAMDWLEGTAPIGPLDLAINEDDITFSNLHPDCWEEITINATVHNIGDADAGEFIVYFAVSISVDSTHWTIPTPLKWITVPHLPAGSSVVVSTNAAFPCCMSNIMVVVDNENQIQEANESNNIADKLLVIQ